MHSLCYSIFAMSKRQVRTFLTNTILNESINMSMEKFEKRIVSLTDTPFGYTLSMIGGKWRLVILYWLVEYEAIRFNELQRKIGTITYKTLSTELKGLEADGLIIRKEYPQIPPKVEYSLSDKGRSLLPIMESMCEWGTENSGKEF